MKKLIAGTAWLWRTAVLAAVVSSPAQSWGQNPIYGKGRGYADQVVLDRMYARREKARRAARRAAARSSKRNRSKPTSSAKRTTPRKRAAALTRNTSQQAGRKVAPATYRYVKFNRDTYQNFHTDDAKGYTVNFTFKPVSGQGKAVLQTYTYNFYNSTAEFNGLPAGRYTVKAEAVYRGKRYPVHLGSEAGTPTDPTGGNFAPSIVITIKPGVDAYGYEVLETSPESLYVRVIE